ncbi:MAG: nitrilase-related carbon-nitrogen hydrolase [Bacteroidota bacterium]|nr:nitrilase-related carbon-nitrogen hydrolase [Bacteroidota bacterium]
MKISLFQYNPVWENKELNKKRIDELLRCKFSKSDLIIFPEMSLTGFSMRTKELAESLSGDSFRFFSRIAQNFQTQVLAGLIEKDVEHFYNTLVHIDESGGLVTSYRKIHPFSFAGEDKFYQRGVAHKITTVKDFKIGLSICYDLRFPELFRFYAKERVHLIIVIANWPVTRIEHWNTLLKARAIENQCFVAGVNRVGTDPLAKYNGYSSLYDPLGNEILLNPHLESIIEAEISIKQVLDTRAKFPFLNDIHLI